MKNVLDIVKKNLVSIISGLIAIGAVVVLFWQVNGRFVELQHTVDARAGDFGAMKGLLTKERHLPQLSLDDTEQKKLDRFPTQPVIALGASLVDQLKAESGAVYDAAVKLNEHHLLVPDSLPAGGSGNAVEFRDKYKQTIDLSKPEYRKNSYLVKLIHGGFMPSGQDIDNRQKQRDAEIRANAVPDPAGGQPFNFDAIEEQVRMERPRIPDQLKREAAENCQLYIEPFGTFDPYTAILTNNNPPEAYQIFSAQMGLWVEEDVCKAIAAANANSKSVAQSPIKHLLRIILPPNMFPPLFPGQVSSAPQVSDDPSQTLTKTYKDQNPTGRSTNGIYDCVRFRVILYVDAEQIPLVLQEFSRGRLLTVSSFSMLTIDTAVKQAQNGYYYGDKPVVELTMFIEDLFMRKWTAQYMPDGTRRALGIPPAK